MQDPKSTHFGFTDVPWEEKARRVRSVFDSVASRYDLMNDLMSGGAHRLWKRFALSLTGLRPGGRALDVAGGTGDLSVGLARQVGSSGLVVLTDINAAMLARGRDRLIDEGLVGNVQLRAGERRVPAVRRGQLRLRDHRLRPAQRHRQAGRDRLDAPRAEARRAPADPGVLQAHAAGSRIRSTTSTPSACCPCSASFVAGDADSYRYLAESIRRHPDQETLLGMMRDRRPRGLPLSQPHRRHRRGPSSANALAPDSTRRSTAP